jgi:hypothetical protein
MEVKVFQIQHYIALSIGSSFISVVDTFTQNKTTIKLEDDLTIVEFIEGRGL